MIKKGMILGLLFVLAGCGVSDEWLKAHPLPAGEELSIHEIGRTPFGSVHIVQVRKREPPHIHERHDLLAFMERGYGKFTLGSKKFTLHPGRAVYVPRGVVHSFENESKGPAVALVISTPPLDLADRVLVGE